MVKFLLVLILNHYLCKYHQSLPLQISSIYYRIFVIQKNMGTEKINRLKIVLVEQGKTGKWLAGQLGKNEATVSRWCSNTSQPSLEMLMKIAAILNVDARRLINNGIEE